MKHDKLFRTEEISKAFFNNLVLENITFDIDHGEVLGLVGENGAGKSTLTKIITGVYKPDRGNLYFDSKKVSIKSVRDAKEIGISVVFQELSLSMNLTVAENIFVDDVSKNPFSLINRKKLYKKAEGLIRQFNVSIKPDEEVGKLTMGNKQIVEILKALAANPKLLILDEPTSSLGERDIEVLFELIRKIKEKNCSVIYISHHLNEIFEITDRVMVLRDGRKVGVNQSNELSIDKLIKMMLGEDVKEYYGDHQTHFKEEDIILKVKNLSRKNKFSDISFDLHRGEILGIVGIIGSGRLEVCNSIFGIDDIDSGQIYFKNEKISINSTAKAIERKIVFLPESRQSDGLFLEDSIKNNITASILKRISKFGIIRKEKTNSVVSEYYKKMNIKAQSLDQSVTYLSGGNQQKVLLSKCLVTQPEILFALDPTRGIDVGSKAEIHKILNEITNDNVSIILTSSEIDEVMALSDRIIVMNNGRIEEILSRNDFDSHNISMAMHKKYKIA